MNVLNTNGQAKQQPLAASASSFDRFRYYWTVTPWWAFLIYAGLCYIIYLFILLPNTQHRTWTTPTKSELKFAEGYLIPEIHNIHYPYYFQIYDGEKLKLLCIPDGGINSCIPQLNAIAGRHAKLKYYKFNNSKFHSTENIPIALSIGEKSIIDDDGTITGLVNLAASEDENAAGATFAPWLAGTILCFAISMTLIGLATKAFMPYSAKGPYL